MMQVETSSMVTILPNCSSASDSEVSNTSKTGPIGKLRIKFSATSCKFSVAEWVKASFLR